MPIEIREIIIKAQIRNGSEPGTGTAGFGIAPEEKEDIVRECVDQVLRILEDKKAR